MLLRDDRLVVDAMELDPSRGRNMTLLIDKLLYKLDRRHQDTLEDYR